MNNLEIDFRTNFGLIKNDDTLKDNDGCNNSIKEIIVWTKEKIKEYVNKIRLEKINIIEDMGALNMGAAQNINYMSDFIEELKKEVLKELEEN